MVLTNKLVKVVLMLCAAEVARASEECAASSEGCPPNGADDFNALLQTRTDVDGEKEGSALKTKLQPAESVVVSESTGGCGCCQSLCYVWGDPHIIQMDGKRIDFMKKSLTHYWLVKSDRIHIQGFAIGRKSWTKGVAIGGDFLGGHKLVAFGDALRKAETTNFRIQWDGNEIPTNQDGVWKPAGGVEIRRDSGAKLLPSEDEINEITNDKAQSKFKPIKDGWRTTKVFAFRMPDQVEVFVTLRDGVEVLVKAPGQSGQSGWCGNANGDDTDDDQKDTVAYQQVAAADDLFAGTPVALDQWRETFKHELESHADEAPPDPERCPATLRAKAESACNFITEANVRKGCIIDICLTSDVTHGVEAAETMAILEALEGKGIPHFVGHGKCLDGNGATFTSFTAPSFNEKRHCVHLLKTLADITGVRGAEFKMGDGCKILVDAGVGMGNEKIPGGWGAKGAGTGHGAVGDATQVDGAFCWKVL